MARTGGVLTFCMIAASVLGILLMLVAQQSPIIGIVAETMCRFHASIAYPEDVEAGLAVGHLGSASVRYEIGLFGRGEDAARADGHFVHVFVDRATMRPVGMPERLREALARLLRG